MFIKLMYSEIKSQLKSITFYMFLIIITLYYITQFNPPTAHDPLKPVASNLKYTMGKGVLVNESNEMNLAFYRMNYNLENNIFVKYTFGMKNWNVLSKDQKEFMIRIKNSIYGDELDSEKYPQTLISYDEFEKLIEKLDKSLGGNTVYSKKHRNSMFWDVLYGYKSINTPDEKIKAGYMEMSTIVTMNEYLKHSSTLNSYKKLSPSQSSSIQSAMEKISPKGMDENRNLIDPVSYSEYEKILDELDGELKDTTVFSKQYRHLLYSQNKSYNDALEEFNEILSKDKLTNAYGRLFSDYLGISAGLYPVFIVIATFLRDKKRKVIDLIHNRELSPITYILSRYSAICICLFAGYLLLATHSTYVFYSISRHYNYLVDIGAFYKYTLTWIAPTVLFTVAISILIFTILDRALPTIVIQAILWFSSMGTLGGDYGFNRFMVRFNSLGDYENYILWRPEILSNRLFFTIVSLVIISITVYVYNRRIAKQSTETTEIPN
ncbi:hypothetical protein R9X47_15855 [Wukongibacter baidiensis]|uniref:hypothetical protein n=1 Tax=Wukongibacter baidiensis TaxID=1723361 RepID=UPI003D7FE4F0